MPGQLSQYSREHVPTVPAALRALVEMERELSRASTYTEIRKVIDAGAALKLLFRDVDVVKAGAEDVILSASARIGEEIGKIPKATGPHRHPSQKLPGAVNSKTGRAEAMPSGTSRARYQKLAAAKQKLKAIAAKLRGQGKDATPSAVVRELTHGDKKERRAEREITLAQKQRALPDRKFGVIYADPEWKFETWSENGKTMTAPENHYPTSPTEVIKARDVPRISADDSVLFLCATVPMLPQALEVMKAWGFDYVSGAVWIKQSIGTGYWFRMRHELLLVGTRGNIPAPAMGTQWDSVIEQPRGKHSEKPEAYLELIEAYFPNLPKIELNRRGPPRPGWSAWGNEVQEVA